MSKGYSGHFNRTNANGSTQGSRYCSGTLPSQQKQSAIKYAENLMSSSNPKIRRRLNTVTVAYDEKTDKMYYGFNGGIEINNSPKNPILFGKNGILPKTSLNAYPVGNCAECDAINNALNAGSKLENLHIYTIHATKKRLGESKLSCENCTYTFKGKVKSNNSGWIK